MQPWVGEFKGERFLLCISDIIRGTDLFMNFTEPSLTDPFIAVFMAAQTERWAEWTNRVVNLSKAIS